MDALVAELIERAGLTHRAEELERLLQRAVHLTTRRVEMDALEIGASRLGGVPDLPPEMEWPEWNGVPQSFVAQIRLSDVAQHNRPQDDGQPCLFDFTRNAPRSLLPQSSWLYIFYAVEQEWGYDPAHRGGWKVLFYEGDVSELRRVDLPAELLGEGGFSACELTFTQEYTLPSLFSIAAEGLDLNREGVHAYDALVEKLRDAQEEGKPTHRLLGHPYEVQNEMQLQCQLVSHGLYCGNAAGYEDPRVEELRSGAADWRLLLQIDTDDDAEMMWGDSGSIYYWMPEQALKARQFDQMGLVLQCC